MLSMRQPLSIRLCTGAGIVLLWTAVGSSQANVNVSVNECVDIANDQHRLACYDQLFRGQSQPQPDVVDATFMAAQKSIAKREAPPPSAERDVNGRITQINKTLHNELLVELDNGQIWRQLSPRFMSIKEGDEVIVKKARLGGYILSTASGGSTRVKQVD